MGVEEAQVARKRAVAWARRAPGQMLDRLSDWDEAVRSRWPFSALMGGELPPDASAGDGSHLLVRPAVLGFVAVGAVTAGAAQGQSPFALKLPGAWFFGVPSAGAASGGSPHPSPELFFGLVAVYGGLVLFMRVWYGLIRTLSQRPGIPVKKVMAVFALWILPLLLVAPLFSRDVYSYAAQGEMMSHHINPYRYGPAVLGAPPAVNLVDPLWVNTPAPYGPLFMRVDGTLTSLSLHHEVPDLELLRLLAILGVALMAVGIASLARTYGRDPSYVLTLAVLNPVTVFHFVGGAHNDALMLGLLAVGLALARRGRPVAGIVLCSLAAAVKVPAAIGVLYIGWEWMGSSIPFRTRVRPVVTAGLIAGGVMGFLSLITGLGWSWVLNLAMPGTVRSWVAPATGAGIALTDIAHLAGMGVPLHTMLSVTRVVGLTAAFVAAPWLLWRSDRVGWLRALGITLLLVVVLGPVVQPWYLAWGIVFLAPVASGRMRSLIVWLSIISAFLGLPGGHTLVADLLSADPLQVAVALLGCLGILTVPLTSLQRQRLLTGRWRAGKARPPLAEGTPNLDYARV
jgi:alpha-1,6-mannosyltransferase